jgi:type IV secretory pathway VirD2 relaxase
MEEKQRAEVIRFSWGSLSVDALNQQTMGELELIARREGTTIEQVISRALDWCLATHEQTSNHARNN